MRCGQKNPTTTNQASHGIEWVGPANESLADLRDGGREAKGKKRIGWDSSRREKPLGTRCHRGCACGALLSVYIDHKLGVASLGASPKKLVVFWKSHRLRDGVLGTADVQPGWDAGSPWEPRRVVPAPFQSFNHLLTQAGLFLCHSRHNFPRARRRSPVLARRSGLRARRSALFGEPDLLLN